MWSQPMLTLLWSTQLPESSQDLFLLWELSIHFGIHLASDTLDSDQTRLGQEEEIWQEFRKPCEVQTTCHQFFKESLIESTRPWLFQLLIRVNGNEMSLGKVEAKLNWLNTCSDVFMTEIPNYALAAINWPDNIIIYCLFLVHKGREQEAKNVTIAPRLMALRLLSHWHIYLF